jgi:Fe-S-cluster containining protein
MIECSMCGNCCERIYTGWNLEYLADKAIKWENGPDPTKDLAGFYQWMRDATTWENIDLEEMLRTRRNAVENYRFVKVHWESRNDTPPEDGHENWNCKMFDTETRMCNAHGDRPPVCSGYPWYGGKPKRDADLSPQCSFNADIKTMLPIVGVTNGNVHT